MTRLISALTRLPWVFCLALVLSGCTLPYRPPRVVGDGSAILGIKEVLGKRGEVDVFLVHGMCTHDRRWAADAINNLAAVLGGAASLTANTLPEPIVFGGETELFQYAIDIQGKKVVAHAIVWSPATIPGKKELCYDRDDSREKPSASYCKEEPISEYTRAVANDFLKNWLMNDCLADAIVYVGPRKQRIQDQMRQAIEQSAGFRAFSPSRSQVLARAATDETPLFLITESLGSKIFFDALLLMVCDSPRIPEQTIRRTAQIFMGANQIPILTLAAPLATSPACPQIASTQAAADRSSAPAEDSLGRLLEKFGSSRQRFVQSLDLERKISIDRIEVAVFTDPNDLLSYPLKGSRQSMGAAYETVDIIVSNDHTWFGALENPLRAHTTYLENPDVRNILACGLPRTTDC